MKTIINTDQAPAAVGPYSQAVKANGFVFTAGQIPIDPATNERVSGGIKSETERVLENLKAVLSAAGSSLDQVIKTTVFLSDMDDFPAMNEVYGKYFSNNPPARSTVQAVLPRGCLLEIDAVALAN